MNFRKRGPNAKSKSTNKGGGCEDWKTKKECFHWKNQAGILRNIRKGVWGELVSGENTGARKGWVFRSGTNELRSRGGGGKLPLYRNSELNQTKKGKGKPHVGEGGHGWRD